MRKKKRISTKKRQMKRMLLTISSFVGPYENDKKIKALNPKDNPYPLIVEKGMYKGEPVIRFADGNHRASGIRKWAKKNKKMHTSIEVINRNGVSYKEVDKLLKKFQGGK